jgi:hypothetical protein
MKKFMKISTAIFVAAILLSFVACASGGSGGSASDEAAVTTSEQPASAEDDAAYESANDGELTTEESAAPESAAGAAGSGAGIPDTNRKITFSASFGIDTKRYDEDYAKINKLVSDADGYIASEESHADTYESVGNSGRSSYFSVRIPVGGYNSFLDNLAKIGQISNKNKTSEDLTSEYFDTEARIEMLEIRRDRLVGYIKSATKADDIVAFERDLSDVLLELDQYEGNKRRLDQLVDYATVEITLSELITPETIGKDGEPLGDRASEAFSLSAKGVDEFLQNAAVFFAGAAPVIALIVVVIVIVWIIIILIRRGREKYYAAHPDKRKVKDNRGAMYMPYAPATHANTDINADQNAEAATATAKPADDTDGKKEE